VTLLTARDWQASLFLLMAMALFAHVPAWRSMVLFVSTYATAFFFSSASIDESINEVVLSEGYTQLSPVTLSYLALVGI
jgi:hypothetical protein